MKKIIHSIYKDYPEHPYVSENRNLKHWENNPKDFPYDIVAKKEMERLEGNVLPGDIIMLWRINFNNFTNETHIPDYFEYKYGINSKESINHLLKLKYIEICSATNSLPSLTVEQIKEILEIRNIDTNGKKDELLTKVINNIEEKELSTIFKLRNYIITNSGKEIITQHKQVIDKHGTKK